MNRSFTLLITTLTVLVLHIGCQQAGDPQKSPASGQKRRTKTQVTVGGKTWEIDPNHSYQAVGVWVNPNPRSLTEAEQVRLAVVQAELKKLSLQTEALNDEASYLQRIEKPSLKIRYTFGMPPHKAQGDIIDLGEFQMEMKEITAP